jgi:hypothetical protein
MRREMIDAFLAADPLHSAGVYKEVRPRARLRACCRDTCRLPVASK